VAFKTILVIDDDASLRALVSALLTASGYRAIEAERGEDALERMREERPDLALLDVSLPGMSGYDVLRELRADFGDRLPIVILSGTRTETYDRVAGLRLGADDYVVKPFAPDELLARVDRLLDWAARDPDPGVVKPAPFNLTRRELEVLRLLAGGATTRAIAGELFVSEKTVASHIQHILVKLDVHTQAQAVGAAFRHGLIEPRGGDAAA
jgi:DNA-binding NarL/FixJ family response regulator